MRRVFTNVNIYHTAGRFRRTSAEKGKAKKAQQYGKKQKNSEQKQKEKYFNKLLELWHYQKEDTRSEEEKEEWVKQSRRFNTLLKRHMNKEQREEKLRMNYVREAMRELDKLGLEYSDDTTPPPEVMRGLMPGEIGPIPEEEIEKLNLVRIDHTAFTGYNAEMKEDQDKD